MGENSGRRRVPGRPVTYGTSDHFLLHFGLESLTDLPGLEELKAAGLLDDRLPPVLKCLRPTPTVTLMKTRWPKVMMAASWSRWKWICPMVSLKMLRRMALRHE